MPVSLADLWVRVERDIPGLGLITLENPTVGDVGKAEQFAATMPKDQRATAFSNALIAATISEPSSTVQMVAGLSEDAVALLAEVTADLAGLRKEYDATSVRLPARERLYRAHQNYYRSLWSGSLDVILQSIRNPFEELYGQFGEAARRASIPYLIGEELGRSLQQMGRVDLKLWGETLGLAGFSLGTEIMESISGQLVGQSLQELVSDLVQSKLPEPYLSDALVTSGLNSSLIHSPLYLLPSVEPMRTPKEVRVRAREADRRRLVDAYDILMTLELRLRDIVEDKLRGLHGDQWWRRGVPGAVKQECVQRKQERESPLGPAYHPIDYCYVDELKSIIIRADNWDQAFKPLFGNKIQVEAMFLWIGPIRNDIAHPRPISDEEYQEFVVAANWLQRRMTLGIGPELSDE